MYGVRVHVCRRSVLREQAHGYVRAIQWILHYYFNGVPSWSWFYDHHYAPYLSDVKDLSGVNLEMQLSEPFKPFEQLMAVLPAASRALLPVPFQVSQPRAPTGALPANSGALPNRQCSPICAVLLLDTDD